MTPGPLLGLANPHIVLTEDLSNGDGDNLREIGQIIMNPGVLQYIRDAVSTSIRAFLTDMGGMRPNIGDSEAIASNFGTYLLI